MISYAKRIRVLSPPAGVLAAYDRASVAHGFRQGVNKAAEIAAQADAKIRSMKAESTRDRKSLDRLRAENERLREGLEKIKNQFGGFVGGHMAETIASATLAKETRNE